MKKKIISLCLVLALALTAIGGATLAYFTDTDDATNTFTTGNVKIELIEQERGDNGLQDFNNNKVLNPIVGSVQGDKDKYGLPTAANYVDKIVTVKNLAQDAYVRVYIAVPAALENNDASKNILHWNVGNKFTAAGDYTGNSNTADYTANMGSVVQLAGTTNIGGIEYNVYYQTYKKVLTKNEVTGSAFMVGMYLDQNVDAEEMIVIDENVGINPDGTWPTKTVYTINGQTIDFDLTNVTIPVFAVGAQAAGFTDADTAINAAFGANYNPWGK